MSVFDLIVLVILAALTIRGVLKGMVSQIVAVGSIFVSWIVASRFAFVIAPSIPAEAPWDKIGAMVVLFVISMIGIRLCHQIFEKWLKKVKLDRLNSYLGGALGFVKGLLVCMVLTFFGVMLSETSREIVFQSKSGKHLALLIEKTGAFIPRDSWELLSEQIDKFKQKMQAEEGIEEPESRLTSLASENNGSADAPEGSRFGQLFAKGSSLLDEVQDFRSEVNKEKEQANSFLDAVVRWWKGEDAQTSESTPASVASKAEVDEKPMFTTQQPAVVRSASLNSAPAAREASTASTERSGTVVPPASLPTPSTATQQSRYKDDALFRRRQSETAPSGLDALPMDGSLLPASSQASVVSPALSGSNAESFSAEAQAMSIPRSSASFRLRSRQSSQVPHADRLLESGQPARSQRAATLFRP